MAQNSRFLFNKWQFSMIRNTLVLLGNNGPLTTFGKTVRPFWSYRNIHGSSQVRLFQQNNKRNCSSSSSDDNNTSAADALDHVQTENRKIIAQLLDISENDVTRIPFKMINKEKALHTIGVLRKFGFTPSSVHLYPELLLMSGGAVENYIRIMQETGFPDVREVFIVRFRTVCKQSLSVLQRKVKAPNVNEIVQRYCRELEEEDSFSKDFISKLPQDTEKMTLFDLRNVMMGRYLGKLLMGSLDKSLDAFAKYPRLYYRSFNWVKRNHNILKDFGFSSEKINSHFYLLHTDPDNLSHVLKIKSLAGIEMQELGHLRPKILMSSYETLLDIESSFIEHEIPFEYVQKYPEVFTLSAATIKQRLEEMDSIPEFQLLKTHPRVARLLYYQTKAKTRLEEFKTMQIRVPSLHLLSTDTKRFQRTLAAGDFRVRGVDIVFYLAEVFQVERQRIRDSLVRQPHWLHIPLVNIKSVLKFIQSVGNFTTDQLVDALPVLLYPKDKVQKEVSNLLESGQARIDDDFFLHMVLYYLERPLHFTGDAVWPEKIIQHEYEEDEGIDLKSSEVNK